MRRMVVVDTANPDRVELTATMMLGGKQTRRSVLTAEALDNPGGVLVLTHDDAAESTTTPCETAYQLQIAIVDWIETLR